MSWFPRQKNINLYWHKRKIGTAISWSQSNGVLSRRFWHFEIVVINVSKSRMKQSVMFLSSSVMPRVISDWWAACLILETAHLLLKRACLILEISHLMLEAVYLLLVAAWLDFDVFWFWFWQQCIWSTEEILNKSQNRSKTCSRSGKIVGQLSLIWAWCWPNLDLLLT